MMQEDTSLQPLETFFSLNDQYKAVVAVAQADPDKFEADIYYWNEEKTDDSGIPLWERVFGPLVLNTQKEAVFMAQSQLDVLAGEMPDPNISDSMKEDFFNILGHEDIRFLKPENFETAFLPSEEALDFISFPPEKIAFTQDFYFILSEKNWYTGFLFAPGQIHCWQKFKTLKQALATILSA